MSVFILGDRRIATFNAAADCIVPPEEFSGAAAAGAADFIIGLLRGDLIGKQQQYIAALDGMEEEAMVCFERSLADLLPGQQISLLEQIEADKVRTAWLVTPAEFFKKKKKETGPVAQKRNRDKKETGTKKKQGQPPIYFLFRGLPALAGSCQPSDRIFRSIHFVSP